MKHRPIIAAALVAATFCSAAAEARVGLTKAEARVATKAIVRKQKAKLLTTPACSRRNSNTFDCRAFVKAHNGQFCAEGIRAQRFTDSHILAWTMGKSLCVPRITLKVNGWRMGPGPV